MLILASTSPRRKELLRKITNDFVIIKPDVDEREYNFPLESYALELSKLKAYDVIKDHPDDAVLACDTVVIYNHQIINKPIDDNDARRILKMLSGQTHYVISGYTFINKNKEVNRNVKTIVKMNELSDSLIDEYIKKGLSKGKAGAYGIQDDYPLVNYIDGSYDNVMGFPTEDIAKHIK